MALLEQQQTQRRVSISEAFDDRGGAQIGDDVRMSALQQLDPISSVDGEWLVQMASARNQSRYIDRVLERLDSKSDPCSFIEMENDELFQVLHEADANQSSYFNRVLEDDVEGLGNVLYGDQSDLPTTGSDAPMAIGLEEESSVQPGLSHSLSSDARVNATCPCCLGGLWQPVVTSCGHHFCLECIQAWMKHSARKTCPACRADLTGWKPDHRNVDTTLAFEARRAFASDGDFQLRVAEAEEWTRMATRLAAGHAFELRVGHRTKRSIYCTGHTFELFVEPVNKTLPLHLLVAEIRFQMHPSSRVASARATGPKYEISLQSSFVLALPSYKVHVIWRDGLGIDPVTVAVDDVHGDRAWRVADRRAVVLPDHASCTSRESRRILNKFHLVLQNTLSAQDPPRSNTAAPRSNSAAPRSNSRGRSGSQARRSSRTTRASRNAPRT